MVEIVVEFFDARGAKRTAHPGAKFKPCHLIHQRNFGRKSRSKLRVVGITRPGFQFQIGKGFIAHLRKNIGIVHAFVRGQNTQGFKGIIRLVVVFQAAHHVPLGVDVEGMKQTRG